MSFELQYDAPNGAKEIVLKRNENIEFRPVVTGNSGSTTGIVRIPGTASNGQDYTIEAEITDDLGYTGSQVIRVTADKDIDYRPPPLDDDDDEEEPDEEPDPTPEEPEEDDQETNQTPPTDTEAPPPKEEDESILEAVTN